jgi:dihydroorotate dehydrogenase
LINRMGFPNQGMARVAAHLRQMPRRQVSSNGGFVLGASLGKQKETPLDEAGADYVAVLRAVYPHADYLAVNVSSPNTPGLRQLQGRRYLESLLGQIQEENRRLSPVGIGRPLLLKIAPDLSWAEIDQILEAAEAQEIDGIIATNTTVERPALSNGWSHEAGGLSGEPLARRSMEIIAYVYRQVGDKMPVIGVGGVTSADDVQARLDAGAALVQLYTGLIYEGPQLAGRLLRALEARRL